MNAIIPPRKTIPIPAMPRNVVPGRLDVAPHDDVAWFRYQPRTLPTVVQYIGDSRPTVPACPMAVG